MEYSKVSFKEPLTDFSFNKMKNINDTKIIVDFNNFQIYDFNLTMGGNKEFVGLDRNWILFKGDKERARNLLASTIFKNLYS